MVTLTGIPETPPINVGARESKKPDEMTLWEVFAGVSAPLAKRYLLELATGDYQTELAAMRGTGGSQNKHTNIANLVRWRRAYPGFRELEERLMASPHVAAYFMAVIYLPKALRYQADKLEKGTDAEKAVASKFILQIGAPERKKAAGNTGKAAATNRKTLARLAGKGAQDE